MEALNNFLSNSNLPIDTVGVTAALGIIVFAFVAISIVKGIIKTIISVFTLAVSLVAFYFGFNLSPPYIEQFIPEAVSWMPLVAGSICALFAVALLQAFFGLLSGKKKKKKAEPISENSKKKKGSNPLAPLFGLTVGIMVLFTLLTGIRHFGTLSELDHLQTFTTEGPEKAGPIPPLARLKQLLDSSPIAAFHERIDPFYDRAKENLAKLIILAQNRQLLAQVLTDEGNREALNTPEIKSISLAGEQQRELCKACKFPELFNESNFHLIATKPSTRRELLKVDLSVLFPKDDPETEDPEKE
ncbi:MAG: hypothetical protein AAGC74_02990 [Verrucomicrobiota bacterium]